MAWGEGFESRSGAKQRQANNHTQKERKKCKNKSTSLIYDSIVCDSESELFVKIFVK